jgi:hypothetical protein
MQDSIGHQAGSTRRTWYLVRDLPRS